MTKPFATSRALPNGSGRLYVGEIEVMLAADVSAGDAADLARAINAAFEARTTRQQGEVSSAPAVATRRGGLRAVDL